MRRAGLVLLAIWGCACARSAAPPTQRPVTAPLFDPKGHPWVAPTPAPGEPMLHGDAAERELVLQRVEGSELFGEDPFAVELHVTADRLTIADSCSSTQIGYTYAHGVLDAHDLPQLSNTRNTCTERSRARLAWLGSLLRTRPQVDLPAGGLVFKGSSGSAAFVDAPRYPLVGTPWQLVSCTAVAGGTGCDGQPQGTITLRDDGTLAASFPCATLVGRYTLAGSTLMVEAPSVTSQACTTAGAKPSTEALTTLLTSGPLELTQQRERLSLVGSAGRVFTRAASAPVRSTTDFVESPSVFRAID